MTEYIAKTAYGAPIAGAPKFQTHGEAIAWARKNSKWWPGCYIEAEETVTRTRRIWTDRSLERAAA
ncbi:hypothetical protein [Phenylobacterium soli]|uniref:Uncharacterized protein n=1 Tax=Phenylobacterium soli TaxID=2170551 RepID=A0A328AA75_9CAUL|nr:hypothetical protein [Phenylobacterium soli]RAK51623.1 hypothetical protein DJ017_17460 [Phenylobacterium soli]